LSRKEAGEPAEKEDGERTGKIALRKVELDAEAKTATTEGSATASSALSIW
jgi:hypothetical protein